MMFNRENLSPMAAARLDACLAKQFRFSDGIRTLGANLEALFAAGKLVSRKATDGAIDWNRRKFNSMNHKEQAAYEKRLSEKRYYWIEDTEGVGHSVPKTVFDAIALPLHEKSL